MTIVIYDDDDVKKFCNTDNNNDQIPGLAMLATAMALNWPLGLVMLGCVPLIAASVGILTSLMSSSTQEGNNHYSKAGGVATEVCTVQKHHVKRALHERAYRYMHARPLPFDVCFILEEINK